jgi:hypothetical protein
MDKICEAVWVDVEIAPAALDDDGNIISPAITESQLAQVERDATSEEQAEIDARRADAAANAQRNAILDQIQELEAANPISPRALREQALIIAQIIERVTGSAPTSPGFTKAADLDAQISALRAQL